jgi:hypothetical protein
MRRFFFTILFIAGIGPAIAQTPSTPAPSTPSAEIKFPDPIKLTVSRATLQLIGQGVMKLPYEAAAPVLTDLQRQLNDQDAAARMEKSKEKTIPKGPEPKDPVKD